MDIVKAIRMAVDTGKVEFGSRKALKHVMHGDCELILIAKNCPKDVRKDIEYYSRLSGVKVVVFEGDNDELAEACGKPFNIRNRPKPPERDAWGSYQSTSHNSLGSVGYINVPHRIRIHGLEPQQGSTRVQVQG